MARPPVGEAMPSKIKHECFVIFPFLGEFEELYQFVIVPTLSEIGMTAIRVDQLEAPMHVPWDDTAPAIDASPGGMAHDVRSRR